MATATAMTECTIMCVEKLAMARALREEPGFSRLFIAQLLKRTARVEADLVDQLFNSSEKRLARALLLLANFGKDGSPSQSFQNQPGNAAVMIGTTRSRVNHFMNKFRKLGLIHYNDSLEVNSSLLDVILHDEPHIHRGDDLEAPGPGFLQKRLVPRSRGAPHGVVFSRLQGKREAEARGEQPLEIVEDLDTSYGIGQPGVYA